MQALSPRAAGTTVATLVRAGLLRPARPDHAAGMALALAYWGISPAGGYALHAVRDARRAAVVDPGGTLTYADVDRLTNAAARALLDRGVGAGQPVGVACGNTRAFVLAVVALGKVGATAVLLNPGLSAPLLAGIERDEHLVAVLDDAAVADLAGHPDTTRPRPPAERGRYVLLTSGTTGRPKGAARSAPTSLDPLVALLGTIPLKAGETTVVASPLFHAWGFAQWLVSVALGSTVVLTGPFDAERTLAALEEHRATALVAVPVMLRRLLAVERSYDTSSLRVVAASGSALPPDVAAAFMDRFGDVVYDLYGSTEVAWATIATPADLRAAPGTVGRPAFGTEVVLVDERNGTGRIFVGNGLVIDAYTSGESKETRGGLMATGDLGRFDDEGRLYVVGREDDMIVSGGENVFPAPVEEVLSALPGVRDAAVVGVPDEEFGQRLRAYVVADGVTEQDVKDAVRERLARHYVPRDVVFVVALPRNAAGKVVKRDL
ncbi:MAG TPA: AMP-binding protein [Mycobacteriales bacterium]